MLKQLGTDSMRQSLKIIVIVASIGRPDLLMPLLQDLANQSRKPDGVIVSVCRSADLPKEPCDWPGSADFAIEILLGEPGLTKQRNRAIDWLHDSGRSASVKPDIILFVDDDFILHENWLFALEAESRANPAVVGFTGLVLADGAGREAYTREQAINILQRSTPMLNLTDWRLQSGPAESLYGCNMAVRGDAFRHVRFDEALPLYGWLEDYDLSAQLRQIGQLTRFPSLVGVHLGHRSARSSGVRLGYSQVANPIYLNRKGTLHLPTAVKYIRNNLIANLAKSALGDQNIDRRGRLRGNLIALRDLLTNSISPDRVEQI